MFHLEFVDMFVFYLHPRFHVTVYRGSLFTAVECKVKYIFCVDGSLLFYILQKNYVRKFANILVIYYSMQLHTLSSGILESACLTSLGLCQVIYQMLHTAPL